MTDQLEKLKAGLAKLAEVVQDIEANNNLEERARAELGQIPYRVIHLKSNPSQMSADAISIEMASLQKENDRLKARLQLLESGNSADMTIRIDAAVNNANRINELTNKLDEFKRREQKIMEAFRKTSRDFRKAVEHLTGFKINQLKDEGLYQVCAEDESEGLSFRLLNDGQVELIDNEYSDRYHNLKSTYIGQSDSYPGFLAAIMLDIFKSRTQLSPVSMCIDTMSTTMVSRIP